MNIKTIVVAVICAILCAQLFAQSKRQADASQFDNLVEDWTYEEGHGFTVGVLNDGEVDIKRSWGMANLEHQVPVHDSTVFLFPGMSEQILAFSLLLEDEKGTLSLDEPILRYLDNLPESFGSITLRSLLHHNSGLNRVDFLQVMAGFAEDEFLVEAEMRALLGHDQMMRMDRRGEHLYNQAGLRLLQGALESVTEMTFHDYAQAVLFEPLGMLHTQIVQEGMMTSNLATGYSRVDDDFKVEVESENMLSCSQIYTTVDDMLLWVDNFWRPRIGSKDLWHAMDDYVSENGRPVKEQNQALFVGHHRYWDFRGEAKYYQIGVSDGYAAKMIRYPEHDLAIVVMGNLGQYNGHLCTMFSEFYLEDLFSDDAPTAEKPLLLSEMPKSQSKYVGHYWDYENETHVSINLVNDTLNLYDERFDWRVNLLPVQDGQYYIDFRSGSWVIFGDEGLTLRNSRSEEFEMVKVESDAFWIDRLEDVEGSYINQKLVAQFNLEKSIEGIVLRHRSHGELKFIAMGLDEYRSNSGYFPRLRLIRDKSGRVEAITLSNRFFKEMRFRKSLIAFGD